MQAYRYDTSFKIAGDTDFFAKAYNNGVSFYHIPLVVSSFSLEGVSSHLSWQMFKEDCQIGYKYNRLFPLLHALKYLFWIIPRVCIRELIPARFRSHCQIGYKYNRLFPLLHALKYLFWIIPRVCIRELIPARFRSQARILLGKKTS